MGRYLVVAPTNWSDRFSIICDESTTWLGLSGSGVRRAAICLRGMVLFDEQIPIMTIRLWWTMRGVCAPLLREVELRSGGALWCDVMTCSSVRIDQRPDTKRLRSCTTERGYGWPGLSEFRYKMMYCLQFK